MGGVCGDAGEVDGAEFGGVEVDGFEGEVEEGVVECLLVVSGEVGGVGVFGVDEVLPGFEGAAECFEGVAVDEDEFGGGVDGFEVEEVGEVVGVFGEEWFGIF